MSTQTSFMTWGKSWFKLSNLSGPQKGRFMTKTNWDTEWIIPTIQAAARKETLCGSWWSIHPLFFVFFPYFLFRPSSALKIWLLHYTDMYIWFLSVSHNSWMIYAKNLEKLGTCHPLCLTFWVQTSWRDSWEKLTPLYMDGPNLLTLLSEDREKQWGAFI